MGINVSDLLVALDSDHKILVICDKKDNMPTQFEWVQRSILAMFGDLVMEQTKEKVILENGSRIYFMSYKSSMRGYSPNTIITCNHERMSGYIIPSYLIKNITSGIKYWFW